MNRTNQNTQMDAGVLTIEQMSWKQTDNNKQAGKKDKEKHIDCARVQKEEKWRQKAQQIAWMESERGKKAKIKIYLLTK